MTVDSKNLPRRKDLLDIESLSREEIEFLLHFRFLYELQI